MPSFIAVAQLLLSHAMIFSAHSRTEENMLLQREDKLSALVRPWSQKWPIHANRILIWLPQQAHDKAESNTQFEKERRQKQTNKCVFCMLFWNTIWINGNKAGGKNWNIDRNSNNNTPRNLLLFTNNWISQKVVMHVQIPSGTVYTYFGLYDYLWPILPLLFALS